MKTVATNLPVIYHSTNDVKFQYHIMNIAKDYTLYLNPSQTAVGCSDQPLYALKKKIQWACADQFPSNGYFAFMGGLHIEQVALKAHSTMIKGTGLEDIIKQAGLKKKARYTLQVIAVCLFKMLKVAYMDDDSHDDTIDQWAQRQDHVMLKYWYGILNHEMHILMLVRSFRESTLSLMMSSCERLAEIFFALDHTQYARWLPVFIQDLKVLSVENPSVFAELSTNMSVRTSQANFSDIAFDHEHEQLKKVIKSTSGYINLVNKEDHDFHRKLEMCCPEINHFLTEVGIDSAKVPKHKEEAASFVQKFIKDCQNVYSKLPLNTFSTTLFQKMVLPIYIFPQIITEGSKNLFVIGEQ
jgi:hypothetical protein